MDYTRKGVVDQGSAVQAQGTAAAQARGSGHTGQRQGSGNGSQNMVQGTEGAQGTATGARALDGRGARLWWRDAQVLGCIAWLECWVGRGLSVGNRGSS